MVSKYWQSVNIDIYTVRDQYEALIKYIINLQKDDMFQQYQEKAIKNCGVNQYETTIKRKGTRIKLHDEQEINLTGSVEFKVNTYFVIFGYLTEKLTYRKLAYEHTIIKFSFYLKLTEMKSSKVRLTAELLRSIYKNDLDTTFINECIHFQKLYSKYRTSAKNYNCYEYYDRKRGIKLHISICIAIRMFLRIPCSNYSAEGSFSELWCVKPYLRSTLSNDGLNALVNLSIEAEITKHYQL